MGRRVELGFALLAMLYTTAHGGKHHLHDFAPHEQDDRPDHEASVDDVIKFFGAIAYGNS